MSEPIHKLFLDLARWSPQFQDDSRARRYWIDQITPLFVEPEKLTPLLSAPLEWWAAQEIAAASLFAAEKEGNFSAQELFLRAIKALAPLTSPQRDYAVARLQSLASVRSLSPI